MKKKTLVHLIQLGIMMLFSVASFAQTVSNQPALNQNSLTKIGSNLLDIDNFLFITKGRIGIEKGNKSAVIDSNGTFVIPWGKYRIRGQSNAAKYGVIVATDDNGMNYLLNADGKVLFSHKEKIEINELGFAVVGYYPTLKVIQVNGKEIPGLTKIYNRRNSYEFELADEHNDLLNYINPDQERMLFKKSVEDTVSVVEAKKLALPPNHTQLISATRARITRITWGYVSISGKETIPFRPYLHARPFSNGMAAVCKLDEFNVEKWGFINEKGEEVIPFQFSVEPGHFNSGLAMIRPANSTEIHCAYIDKTGKVIYSVPKRNKRDYYLLGEEYGGTHKRQGYYMNGYTIHCNLKGDQFYLVDTLGNRKDFNLVLRNNHIDLPKGALADISTHDLDGIYFRIRTVHSNDGYGILYGDGRVRIPPMFSYPKIDLDSFSDLAIAFQERDPAKNEPKYRIGVINKQGKFILEKGEGPKW